MAIQTGSPVEHIKLQGAALSYVDVKRLQNLQYSKPAGAAIRLPDLEAAIYTLCELSGIDRRQ